MKYIYIYNVYIIWKKNYRIYIIICFMRIKIILFIISIGNIRIIIFDMLKIYHILNIFKNLE